MDRYKNEWYSDCRAFVNRQDAVEKLTNKTDEEIRDLLIEE